MSQFLAYSPQSPRIPDHFAVVYVALSVIIMSYSTMFGFVSILAFFAIWLPHALYKKTFVLSPSGDLFLAVSLPLLCIYSTLWSEYAGNTLYSGVEFLAMIICAVIMARTVTIMAFAKGIALGCAVTLLATLVNGSYAEDYMTKTYALIGLFTSKNQVGFISEVGLCVSLVLTFAKIDKLQKIFFAFMPLVISAVCLYMSNSATSVMSLLAVVAVLCGVYCITRLPQGLRIPALIAGIFAVATIVMFAIALDVSMVDTILGSFGKTPR